jgi:hypothetical protein
LWFDANEHFMVEFMNDSQWLNNMGSIYVTDMINAQPFYFNFSSVPMDSRVVLDFTELFPTLVFNQQDGGLSIYHQIMADSTILEQVSWGNDLTHSVIAPAQGRSIIHGYTNMPTPEGYPYAWYIGDHPTPGEYNIVATHNFSVHITYQDGSPIAALPLYYNTYVPPFAYTDENGFYTHTYSAGRWRLIVRQPVTDEIFYNQMFWLNPDGTTDVYIQLPLTDNEDEVLPLIQNGLKAYPVPFSTSRSGFISFNYNGNTRLVKDSYIRLYDTKGRFVTQIPYFIKGATNWTPPAGMASGMYLARLISGNRFVDTTSFSIIK